MISSFWRPFRSEFCRTKVEKFDVYYDVGVEGRCDVELELFAGFADWENGAYKYSEGCAGDPDAIIQN